MDWRCGSSGKVTGLQVLSPEFKPHFHQEKKKKIEEIMGIWILIFHISSKVVNNIFNITQK
jgi:hypothetical protein